MQMGFMDGLNSSARGFASAFSKSDSSGMITGISTPTNGGSSIALMDSGDPDDDGV